LNDALQRVVGRLENDPSLFEPNRLRERLEAIDLLDSYLPDAFRSATSNESLGSGIDRRARAICAKLEHVNGELYEAIRKEIQRGSAPETLFRWIRSSAKSGDTSGPVNGSGYDYLDELISGVLQFEEPNETTIQRESEKVFYQPTPVRHILDMIGQTALTEADVLVDLGAGLGHVPLMVSICTRAPSTGIELEATYVERAQQCAQKLNLNNVTFIHQDARAADLSAGTVFYLYTPFTGSILSHVLALLRREAETRQIRICTFGPCTPVVAEQSWLEATGEPETNRIALFRSHA
jgi:histone methylation protein DOT1